MATSRFTILAAATGLLAVLLGIVPTQKEQLDANATNTSAFNATDTIVTTGAEWVPLALLILVCGAVLMSTGVLRGFR